MLAYILIALAVIVILFFVIVATRPPEFRVVRSATMSAAPGAVFAQVNDLRKWQAWSPWENIDPNLKRKYEGAAAGAGAVYSWQGNKGVGEGRMTITESRPNELINIKLEFLKPYRNQRGRVHVRPARWTDNRQLVDARQEQFHLQSAGHVLQHGQNARWAI